MASIKGIIAVVLFVAVWSLHVEGRRAPHLYDHPFDEMPGWPNYHPHLKPEGLVHVNSTTYVRMLGPLCKHKSMLDLQITYRESFFDPRLQDRFFSHHGADEMKTISGIDFGEYLWTPDTFFRNSIKEELLGAIAENSYARISADGNVRVSRRLQLTIACPKLVKDLKAKGKASCNLEIASYGYRKSDMEYQWTPTVPVKLVVGADSMMGSMDDLDIKLKETETESCDVTTATGAYSCIGIKFNFALDN